MNETVESNRIVAKLEFVYLRQCLGKSRVSFTTKALTVFSGRELAKMSGSGPIDVEDVVPTAYSHPNKEVF